MHGGASLDTILQHWGLVGASVIPIANNDHNPTSTWDINGKFVLKRNHSTDELMRNHQMSELLAAQGIPIATYVPTKAGQITSPDGLYSLSVKLPGACISIYEQPELAPVLGRALAHLHQALKTIESEVTLCYDNDLISEWNDYIKPGLNGAVSDDLIAFVETRFLALYPKLPRQIIHRDAHLQNMLFYRGQLSGWFDFDLSRRDVRLFDLVYMMSSFQPTALSRIEDWKIICQAILSGYEEVQSLSAAEHEALVVLMLVNGLLFVSFWGYENNLPKRHESIDLVEWIWSNCSLNET